MCEIEKEFSCSLAAAMVRYLNEKHPMTDVKVSFTPVKKHAVDMRAGKSGAYILLTDTPVIKAYICVGTSSKPAEPHIQMRRIAHEYRHALQKYRDGWVRSDAVVDAAWEKDAWEFANAACSDFLKEANKYLTPIGKRTHPQLP